MEQTITKDTKGRTKTEVFRFPQETWNITELTGYEPMTTFWQDFAIADRFGDKAIKDTYRHVKAEWKDNYVYWTELCLVLNHRCWKWYNENSYSRSELYQRLYEEANEMTYDWLEKWQAYYFRITD